MNNQIKACKIIVQGIVQGVGFRWFVKTQAQSLGVSGWVKNRPDGGVEAEICGIAESVDQLIQLINQGPSESRVEDLKIFPLENLFDGHFQIRL